MSRNLCWTVTEILEKAESEGGFAQGLDWGIAGLVVESDEVRMLLDMAANANSILDLVYDRLSGIAAEEAKDNG